MEEKYIIIFGNEPGILQSEVNIYVNQGYRPIGGICFAGPPYNEFYQAMFKGEFIPTRQTPLPYEYTGI